MLLMGVFKDVILPKAIAEFTVMGTLRFKGGSVQESEMKIRRLPLERVRKFAQIVGSCNEED